MAIPEKNMEDWKIRCYKCIPSRGNYFKGDKIDLQEKIKIFLFQTNSPNFLPALVSKITILLGHKNIVTSRPQLGTIQSFKSRTIVRFVSIPYI